jgi:hypothetical protein
MSLLQLKEDTTRTAATNVSGEDLAKGSSYILWTAILAFVLVTVGITAFVMSDRKPPVAAGEITQVWAHPVHMLNTPVDAAGVQSPGEIFDQVMVLAQVRVRNQSNQPIVLKDMLSNITLEDGIHSSYAAGKTDYDRIFIAYPELAGLRTKTLVRDTIIQPNEVLDGMIISAFHISPEQWAARKDLNFTLAFKYHPNLTLVPTGPVLEK